MPGAPGARCSRLFLPRPLPVPVPCRSPFPVSPPLYPSRCQVLSGSPPLLLSPLFSSPPRPVPFRPSSPGKAKAQRRAEAEPCRAGGARGPPWHQTSATSSDGACDDRAAKVRAGRSRRDGTVPVPVPGTVPAERGLARVAQLSPTGNGPGRVPQPCPVPSPHPRCPPHIPGARCNLCGAQPLCCAPSPRSQPRPERVPSIPRGFAHPRALAPSPGGWHPQQGQPPVSPQPRPQRLCQPFAR